MTELQENGNSSWDADTIYRKINPKGRWQIGVYLLHCMMYTTLAFHYLAFVFQVDTPAHHCKIPANKTKNETIPKEFVGGEWVDSKCYIYVNSSVSNETVKCTEWQFDPNSGYISTIVTDFNLVCGKNILVEISLMISNLTLAICQVVATKLADTYGRKPVFMGACMLRCLFGVAKAFSPNMVTYIILDALVNVSMTGFTATLLLMSMELFPTEYRSMAGTSLEFFWFVSIMLTSLLVYLFRNWRVLQLILYGPLIFGVVYFWLIDESVPWLVALKRYGRAEKIIRRGAKINKVPVTDDIFSEGEPLKGGGEGVPGSVVSLRQRNTVTGSSLSLRSAAEAVGKGAFGSGPIWVKRDTLKVEEKSSEKSQPKKEITFLSIFRSRRMLFISLINFFLWFVNSFVYTVINLTVTYLAGDRYLNFFLLSLAELPAIISFHFALNKYGRRWPICIYHVLCGIALLLTLLQVFGVDAPWLGITLNFVAKFAISASYCAILVYAPELYPTSVRSMFFGLCWFFAYIAQLIAPYSRPLESIVPGVVRGVCGALSILVGLMVLLLPETFMRPFPQTVEEVENWTITVSEEEKQRYKNHTNTAETKA